MGPHQHLHKPQIVKFKGESQNGLAGVWANIPED